MAIVKPFRGVRYDRSVVGDLSSVVSPPYDVISPADRIFYHEKHPENFVRLVLGQELPDDNDRENRFIRTRRFLDDWTNRGVLKQDTTPAIYVYEQQYSANGRSFTIRGFTLLVRIEDYASNIILPHENTLAKPKYDLIQLLRAAESNFDSIYSLYPDREHALTPILDDMASTEPAAEVYDKDSVRHRLWIIDAPGRIGEITSFLADKEIVIADGHHRYETSLNYRNERRAAGSSDGSQPYDFVLMTVVNVFGKDMTIFPTHRMVRNVPDDLAKSLLSKLAPRFEVQKVEISRLAESMASLDGKAVGLHTREGDYLLSLKVDPQPLIGKSKAYSEMDLAILHSLILEDALGIDEVRLKQESNVTYTRDEAEAVERVNAGEYQMAFLMNPIEVETVLEVARAGEKMPQKATYFYPKLISGLVLRRM